MLKKIWEIIEDIAGRNDKEKEQDAIKVQQNVEDFISNAKANFNDNYSKTTLPSYVSLSSNNYIKDLKIKDYKINFNKDKLDYSIKVNNKLNKL